MGDLAESLTSLPMSHPRPSPVREDCWSEEATSTLIQAWGQRYLELNRGNLRQKHWQEVADFVNARHGHVKKAHRTDIQCKNRIDTLKKKYKIEKARVLDSNGSFVSEWPFFAPLDLLIGSAPTPLKKSSSPQTPLNPPMAVPLLPYRRLTPSPVPTVATVVPQKRPSSALSPPVAADESYFRKNYSAVAAAAAAADESDDEEDEEEELEESRSSGGISDNDGLRKLARAIERFSEVYARVEADKHRQMIELEKQRMQFAKELECQRMQMLVEMQVQLEKVKRAKRSDSNAQEMIYEAVLPLFLADILLQGSKNYGHLTWATEDDDELGIVFWRKPSSLCSGAVNSISSFLEPLQILGVVLWSLDREASRLSVVGRRGPVKRSRLRPKLQAHLAYGRAAVWEVAEQDSDPV
ncbi:hypothetical protein Dimus_032656 [Dionaea muscipula]